MKDKSGKELQPGDLIVYSGERGLKFAKVTKVVTEAYESWRTKEQTIKTRISVKADRYGKVTLRNSERILKVERSQVPAEILEKLGVQP